MSTFLRRLKFYGLGFGIGLVFVFLFFQNRGCSWLPENRVKNAILDRVIVLPEQAEKWMKEHQLSKKQLIALLNDGEVDFDLSRRKGKTKVYCVANDQLKAWFTLQDESFISEVHPEVKTLSEVRITKTGMGLPIRFPKDDNLIFVEEGEKLSCQLDQMGYIDQRKILQSLKKEGRIDFSKSKPETTPKPEVYIWFKDKKGKEAGAMAIWYQNKINIQHMDYQSASPCK